MNNLEVLQRLYGVNQPLTFADIQKAVPQVTRGRVNQLIAEAIRSRKLVRYQQGIFYLPTQTAFGLSKLSAQKVIEKKYLADQGDVYGIYSGIKLLNVFGLTTQVPNLIEVVTNREATKRRLVTIGTQQVVLKKARVPIDKRNVAALTVWEIFHCVKAGQIEALPLSGVRQYMRENNLTMRDLMEFAPFMPGSSVKKLLISGVADVFA